MKKLIKMYNEKYGDTLGVIDDDFNKEQMYRIYYFIKNNCDDKAIQERLDKIKLDKPKTLEQQLTKLESENGNSNIKKYIDNKITVKILPVDVDKNYATNVADLEENSIYMSPNDAKFLYLGYEKLNGSFSGFYITGKPHGKFVYTGHKDDSKIEIMIEGTCYTAYFKTDTEDAHTEKTVYYLTKNNTIEYTPTTDYHPATKKYVDDSVNQLKSIKVFETFPNDTILESLPVDSTFEVKGFYSTGDMQKCLYKKTTKYVSNSIPKANSTYYIKPITSNENIVFLPYYGIRAGKQYSSQNSTILSNITLKHGTTLKLPVGDYYFENPMDLKTKQLSLIGECMSFTPDSNTNGITKLIFNNLQEGQSAITIGTGSLFNVCILGNSEHYDYTIDRSKTYTDKNNIEKEVSTIKNYGIKGGAITTINNVVVQNFYYGAYLDTSNIYINNFFARKCHIGLSIGGDTKCKGVYGWDIHTLLQIRNSISSAIQVRADSCHHLVHLIGYSGSIYLADLDGDYCLGSLLKIGNAGEWGSIGSLTVNGMHGRACCLNVYNTETDTAPTSSNVTEAEVSNYGFISIEKNNRLDGAIITLNAIINDNPLDGASNYLTPQILIASAGVCYAMFNTTFLSTYGTDGSIRITKQNLLNSVALLGDSANNTRISINTNSAIYYINKTNPTDINVYKQTVETLE